MSAYNYKLVTEMQLKPHVFGTKDATDADLHQTDHIKYLVGASGGHPRLRRRTGSISGGLEPRPEEKIAVREGRAPHCKNAKTDEQANPLWHVMQRSRKREQNQNKTERLRMY